MSLLKIKRLHPQARLPQRQTQGSAGHDICACLEQPVTILPGQTEKIPTGFAMELEDSATVALIVARSSLGTKYGVTPANNVGVIDSDYRGEVSVVLRNAGSQPFTVNPGDRIAQMLIVPVLLPQVQEVQELSQTQRGAGGFGSTGR